MITFQTLHTPSIPLLENVEMMKEAKQYAVESYYQYSLFYKIKLYLNNFLYH